MLKQLLYVVTPPTFKWAPPIDNIVLIYDAVIVVQIIKVIDLEFYTEINETDSVLGSSERIHR